MRMRFVVWCTILLSESVRTDSFSECDASHSSKSILRVDIPIDWNFITFILFLKIVKDPRNEVALVQLDLRTAMRPRESFFPFLPFS